MARKKSPDLIAQAKQQGILEEAIEGLSENELRKRVEKNAAAQAIMGDVQMPGLRDLLDKHGHLPAYSSEWQSQVANPVHERIAQSPVSDAAKGTIAKVAQEYAAQHVHGYMPLKEIYQKVKASHPDLTQDAFLHTVMQGQQSGQFELHPFTSGRYQLSDEDYDFTIPSAGSLMQFLEVKKMAQGGQVGYDPDGTLPPMLQDYPYSQSVQPTSSFKAANHDELVEWSKVVNSRMEAASSQLYDLETKLASPGLSAQDRDALDDQRRKIIIEKSRLVEHKLGIDDYFNYSGPNIWPEGSKWNYSQGGTVPVMLEPGEKVEEPDGDAWRVPKMQGKPESGDTFPANLEPGSRVTPKSQVESDKDVQHLATGGVVFPSLAGMTPQQAPTTPVPPTPVPFPSIAPAMAQAANPVPPPFQGTFPSLAPAMAQVAASTFPGIGTAMNPGGFPAIASGAGAPWNHPGLSRQQRLQQIEFDESLKHDMMWGGLNAPPKLNPNDLPLEFGPGRLAGGGGGTGGSGGGVGSSGTMDRQGEIIEILNRMLFIMENGGKGNSSRDETKINKGSNTEQRSSILNGLLMNALMRI